MCAGISGTVKVCVSAPPVLANVLFVKPLPCPTPIGALPRKSGSIKFAGFTGLPNVVPSAVYKSGYVA